MSWVTWLQRVLRVFHTIMASVFLLFVVTTHWPMRWVRRDRPRIVFGALPLINHVYHVQAVRAAGYDAISVVHGSFGLVGDEAFDRVYATPARGVLRNLFAIVASEYVTFLRLIWTRDVFFYYFNSFYLFHGAFPRLEVLVLKLLGKRIIVTHYGSDVTDATSIRDVMRKHVTVIEYPRAAIDEARIRANIRFFTRHADVIFGGDVLGADHLPRVDHLVSSPFCIDQDTWNLPRPTWDPDERPLRVLHAPNHRLIKGTQHLLDAVTSLQDEGAPIELVLMENASNTEVRQAMADCDVVADQFIMGWYAMFSLEAMAAGRPTLCYLRPDLKRLHSVFNVGSSLPLIDTDWRSIKEALQQLIDEPASIVRIGEAGRKFVRATHSIPVYAEYFEGLINEAWLDTPFDSVAFWKACTRRIP